ncbi:MAG TPA: carboxymuconolactone decarboxylase family protein [Tepidisphaeraceae bacterium]
MSYRIAPVEPSQAGDHARELLGAVQAKLGVTPNMMKTFARSPAALEGYLSFNGALGKGLLPAKVREQIALAVSQENGCEYCLAAHTLLGGKAGLKPDQLIAARKGQSDDAKTRAELDLARQVLAARGNVTDAQLAAARAAGISDGEITEVVAHVALNVLTNYFNALAGTVVDFPPVSMKV